MTASQPEQHLLRLVACVVSAHISHNPLPAEELPTFIRAVYDAFSKFGVPALATAPPEPAVPIKKSVFPNYLVCLEDGRPLRMLRRHLMTSYGMTPDDYRLRWGLPDTYPMVAPSYAAARSIIAKKLGLGHRTMAPAPPDVEVQYTPAGTSGKRHGRKKQTTA